MSDDATLARLAARVGAHLMALQRRVVTAESCTAGWIAKALTDPAGSSRWFERGYITYSDEAKRAELGVQQATLDLHGAVSEPTVKEMVRGALVRSGADVAVAVSGIAGPGGGTEVKPVGTVWLALQWLDPVGSGLLSPPSTRVELFSGSRDDIRRQAVAVALQMLLDGAPISSTRR